MVTFCEMMTDTLKIGKTSEKMFYHVTRTNVGFVIKKITCMCTTSSLLVKAETIHRKISLHYAKSVMNHKLILCTKL